MIGRRKKGQRKVSMGKKKRPKKRARGGCPRGCRKGGEGTCSTPPCTEGLNNGRVKKKTKVIPSRWGDKKGNEIGGFPGKEGGVKGDWRETLGGPSYLDYGIRGKKFTARKALLQTEGNGGTEKPEERKRKGGEDCRGVEKKKRLVI